MCGACVCELCVCGVVCVLYTLYFTSIIKRCLIYTDQRERDDSLYLEGS